MVPGCRRIGGGTAARMNRRVDSSAMGNLPAMTRRHGAREDSGVEGLNRWVSAVSISGAVMRGRRGGKRPTKLFLFWNSYPI
jgi:hypothetical protein